MLGYSFEDRPNSRVFATADSVMTIGLSINRCSHSKKNSLKFRPPPPPSFPQEKSEIFPEGREGSIHRLVL